VEQALSQQAAAPALRGFNALIERIDTQQPPAKAGGLGLRTESPDTRRLNDAS